MVQSQSTNLTLKFHFIHNCSFHSFPPTLYSPACWPQSKKEKWESENKNQEIIKSVEETTNIPQLDFGYF